MPKNSQTGQQPINYVPNLNILLGFIRNYSGGCPISNCNNSHLIEIEQDSPEHLRFIPQCLDIQSPNRGGNNLIKIPIRASNLTHNQLYRGKGKTPIKRETYIEFSEQKGAQLILRIVTSSTNILNNLNNTTNINTRIRKYYHIQPVIINTNNIQQSFNTQIPIFLNILNILYP